MGDYDRGGWGNQGGFNQGGFNQGGGFNDRGGDRGDSYGGAWGGGRWPLQSNEGSPVFEISLERIRQVG